MNAGFMPSHRICLLEGAQADYAYIAVMQEPRNRTKNIQKKNYPEVLPYITENVLLDCSRVFPVSFNFTETQILSTSLQLSIG